MPRSGRVSRRKIKPDPKYGSEQITRFVNKVLRKGKKSLASRIVYNALEEVGQKTKQDGWKVLAEAIKNVTPRQEIRPRRVGGATFQVPMPVGPVRGESLAMRWIIQAAKKKVGEMEYNLALQIIAAAKNEGEAVKKKEEVHRIAEANRAFAHFRW